MSRRTLHLLAAIVIGLSLVAVIVIAVRSHLNALDITATAQPALPPSSLDVTVTEDGKPATGLLIVSGDCPASPLPSEAGQFHCDLKAVPGESQYAVDAIRFQSFTSNTVYGLPILPQTRDPGQVVIAPNSHLSLKVTVVNGQLQLSKFDGSRYVAVDPSAGLP